MNLQVLIHCSQTTLLKCGYSEVQVSIGILAHWYRPEILTYSMTTVPLHYSPYLRALAIFEVHRESVAISLDLPYLGK